MGVFAARIGHFPRRGVGLLDPRDHLAADWAIFIRRIDEVEEVGSDGQRQFCVGQDRACPLLGGEGRHEPFKLVERNDAVFELPTPVVPLVIRHIVPKSTSGGSKLFKEVEPWTWWRLNFVKQFTSPGRGFWSDVPD